MENEEEDLKIAKNQDLNEEAEYAGNKQDLEQMLLDAQRYLNIFHQIHIFNDKKKAEFEQSLIEIPDKLRGVLLNLPGGRVLVEHIEDCEIKRGIRKERTVFDNENPIIKSEKEMENSAINNKEFTKELAETIAGAMAECNKNLFQMNEKILNNIVHNSDNDKDSAKQVSILADALRENNQQQMEMMKSFGSTLSQAILMSQKEIFGSVTETPNKVSAAPKSSEVRNNVTQMPEKTENFYSSVAALPNKSSNNEEPVKAKTEEKNQKQDNISGSEIKVNNPKLNEPKKESFKQNSKPVEPPASKIEPKKNSDNDKKDNLSEIDISSLLAADNKEDNKITTKPNPISSVVPALQKIKDAIITKPDDISVESLKVEPLSLDSDEDDLTSSFSKAFASKDDKLIPQTTESSAAKTEDEEWEYVDEDGNPIDPSEWEYVDEDGNPVDPSEWEYVDEDGNPVDPSEWEYVDENGNPIAK